MGLRHLTFATPFLQITYLSREEKRDVFLTNDGSDGFFWIFYFLHLKQSIKVKHGGIFFLNFSSIVYIHFSFLEVGWA